MSSSSLTNVAAERFRHFEPLGLGAAPLTVHNDSSQQRASLGKAAVIGVEREL